MIDALRSKLLTYCPFVFIYYKFKRDSGGGGGRKSFPGCSQQDSRYSGIKIHGVLWVILRQ